MNDFTKEELERIMYCVVSRPVDDLILINKIQSLINNYPVHLDISELETQTR